MALDFQNNILHPCIRRLSIQPFTPAEIQKKSTIFAEEESFEATFTQLGCRFSDGMSMTLKKVPELLEKGVLRNVRAQVYPTLKKFDFHKNGFEFHNFHNTALGNELCSLAALSNDPESKIWESKELGEEIENTLSKWGKQQGIEFDTVVWVDTVYRNTFAGKFGAVHLVHVDFPNENFDATLRGHSNWKSCVTEKFGEMTDEEYERLDVQKIVNIWMPLNDLLEAEPLAIMDLQTLGSSNALRVYQDERIDGGAYPSIGVFPFSTQRWYIKKNMGLEQGVIFNSCRTPHSAITLPDQGKKSRKSLECRVLFLNEKN